MKNKVIVAGSINMDIVVSTNWHPKIGETVIGKDVNYYPGGKGANQAVASSRGGAPTIIIGNVGKDVFAKNLMRFLQSESVDLHIKEVKNTATGTALIVVSTETSDNNIVVVPGANFTLDEKDLETVIFNEGDVLVSQFEIPINTIISFFKKGRIYNCINVFNTAPAVGAPQELFELIDVLILNETELEFYSNQKIDFSVKEQVSSACLSISNNSKMVVIITLGKDGAALVSGKNVTFLPGNLVKAIDTTGAGDCFVGNLASSLVAGKSIEESVKYANVAASLSVTKKGASPSMPDKEEVNKRFKSIYYKKI